MVENDKMQVGFKPIVNDECVAVILGSMPSEESLRQQKYYGNPRNHFWELVYSQFNIPVSYDYAQRCAFLINHKIALWDVFYSAEREGSLDSNIKNGVPNDFKFFFKRYPNIKCIFFNGSKAEEQFKRSFKDIYNKMQHFSLPSSSPANTKPISEKKKEWAKIFI